MDRPLSPAFLRGRAIAGGQPVGRQLTGRPPVHGGVSSVARAGRKTSHRVSERDAACAAQAAGALGELVPRGASVRRHPADRPYAIAHRLRSMRFSPAVLFISDATGPGSFGPPRPVKVPCCARIMLRSCGVRASPPPNILITK